MGGHAGIAEPVEVETVARFTIEAVHIGFGAGAECPIHRNAGRDRQRIGKLLQPDGIVPVRRRVAFDPQDMIARWQTINHLRIGSVVTVRLGEGQRGKITSRAGQPPADIAKRRQRVDIDQRFLGQGEKQVFLLTRLIERRTDRLAQIDRAALMHHLVDLELIVDRAAFTDLAFIGQRIDS